MKNVPTDLKYAETHEWVRVEGDTATVGISDHAQQELTDIVFVELPRVGDAVERGKPCAVVESVKAASDIYAPVSGEVTAINAAVEDRPAIVNEDPYGNGWLFQIRLRDPAELGKLKSAAEYRQQIGG